MLFLCTGNSARSQIAEALAVARSGGRVQARSAGSHPKPLHPNAVRIMREDARHRHQRPCVRSTSTPSPASASTGSSPCATASARSAPSSPAHPVLAHWSLADPAAGQDPEDDDAALPAFRDTAAELETRIPFLLADLARPTEAIPA